MKLNEAEIDLQAGEVTNSPTDGKPQQFVRVRQATWIKVGDAVFPGEEKTGFKRVHPGTGKAFVDEVKKGTIQVQLGRLVDRRQNLYEVVIMIPGQEASSESTTTAAAEGTSIRTGATAEA